MVEKNLSRQKNIYAAKWIFSILFICNGLLVFRGEEKILSSFCFFCCGVLLIPSFSEYWKRKIPLFREDLPKWITIIALFIIAIITSKRDFLPKENESEKSNSAVSNLLDSNNKVFPPQKDNKSTMDTNSAEFIVEKLSSKKNLTKTEKIQLKESKKYVDLMKAEGIAEAKYEETNRLKLTFENKCLSKWDGSCPGLVSYVTQNMNDPRSFEHIETKYFVQNNYMVLVMKYRGKNAFGALVINYIKAKVNFNCEVTEIMEVD